MKYHSNINELYTSIWEVQHSDNPFHDELQLIETIMLEPCRIWRIELLDLAFKGTVYENYFLRRRELHYLSGGYVLEDVTGIKDMQDYLFRLKKKATHALLGMQESTAISMIMKTKNYTHLRGEIFKTKNQK